MKISSVILATKNESREASALAVEIEAWLDEQGVSVYMPLGSADEFKPGSAASASDLIIILGGDGTILSRARNMLELEIPFLGINLGRVGFMADISPLGWKEQLAGIFAASLSISRRVVLGYELMREEKTIKKGCAINEVVLNRGELARLITVGLDLPGGVRQDIRSDGIIFSTPTGSTAYSVSAGGPLVHPDLEVMIITSICPFLHDFNSLVLPSSETAMVSIAESDTEAYLTIDGQLGTRLMAGDRIRILRHDRDFKVLCSPVHSFTSKLAAKGFLSRRSPA